jgi:hypothetical protein
MQAQPKILKNDRNTKSTNKKESFPKNTMFSTLKVQWSQKFVSWLLDGVCRLNPKRLKKIVGT